MGYVAGPEHRNIYSFIYSLNTCYVPSTVLGTIKDEQDVLEFTAQQKRHKSKEWKYIMAINI